MKPANFAPMYAGLYPGMAEIARSHGYALAVHGSLGRDIDLVCIPWADAVSHPQTLVDAFSKTYALRQTDDSPNVHPHGRLVYTLIISFGECFVDLSFTPFPPAPAQEPRS